MLIGERYKVESDSMNVTLYKKEKNKKNGDSRWRAIGYFGTPKQALEHLVNLEVNETGLKDLVTVVKKQAELVALIRSLGGLEVPPK